MLHHRTPSRDSNTALLARSNPATPLEVISTALGSGSFSSDPTANPERLGLRPPRPSAALGDVAVARTAEGSGGWYQLSAGAQFLLVLCILNGTLGLLFSHMFSSGSVSFQIAVVKHEWDATQKAAGCFRAGVAYLLLGFLVLGNPLLTRILGLEPGSSLSTLCCKARNGVRSKCRKFIPKDRLTLLGYTHKGSDDSDGEEELEVRRPV